MTPTNKNTALEAITQSMRDVTSIRDFAAAVWRKGGAWNVGRCRGEASRHHADGERGSVKEMPRPAR